MTTWVVLEPNYGGEVEKAFGPFSTREKAENYDREHGSNWSYICEVTPPEKDRSQ